MTSGEPVDPGAFRRLLGQFATGVTVITVQHDELMHGMTANAFTSLSLDPPLVLFCVGKQSRMAGCLEGAEGFAVNILAEHQEEVSRHFAGRKETSSEIDLLQRGPIAPLIPGALGSLSCAIEARHEGGDHWIIVGRVIEIHEPEDDSNRKPLVFFRSRYARLTDEDGSPRPAREEWSNDAILIYHDEWTVGDEPPPEEHIRAHIWK